MFTPNEIEAMPSRLEKLYRDLQLNIMTDLVRRMTNMQDISSASDWQLNRLYELGMSKAKIQMFVKETLEKSDIEIERIFEEVIQSGYARDESLYSSAGKDFIPYEENEALQQLVSSMKQQTKDECKNITQSLGFAVEQPDGKLTFKPIADYYQNTLDKAVVDITSGAFDYTAVLNRTVREMTDSGLRTVDYASGWNNRVEVAARRAVLSGFNQVVAKINEDNAKQLETDTYEVSWHSGHRPSHWWGGKWYTYAQLVSICGLGAVDGLCGANCYHSYSPVIPGVSKPTYTEEQLEKMVAEEQIKHRYGDKEYTKYEALQKQRRLETTMRAQRQKIKLLEEGNADEDAILAAKAKYFRTSDEYVKFSEAMDLPQQRERVNIDGSGTVKSIKLTEGLINKDYDDIINLKGMLSNKDVRKWYINKDKNIPSLIDITQSLENQAKEACSLRNQYKFQARELMRDKNMRSELDKQRPIMDFDYYYEKYSKSYDSDEEIFKAIIDSSARPNKKVNKSFGLEE